MDPRPILPGTTYMITRRTTQQQFLLRPSRAVNQCIRYCLARAQAATGVAIHAAVFLSNHYHLIVTDPRGELPAFVGQFNRLLARALNCHLGRWENFWAGGVQTSYVRLESEDAIIAKTAYALANPTDAGLVESGGKWPGVRLFRPARYWAKRPSFFFRGGALAMPEELALELTPPPLGTPANATTERIKRATIAREGQMRRRMKSENRSFLGAEAVKRQRITARPRRPAPRRGLAPSVACRDKWRRIEVLQRLKDFVRAYRDARERLRAGEWTVEFPPGTYLLRERLGVCCGGTG